MTLGHPCPQKTRADLDWDRLTRALAERCAGALGRALAMDLPFATTADDVRSALGEAEEATILFDAGEPLPLFELPDVRDAIGRLRVNGVLAPRELTELAKMLEISRVLRRFLASRKDRAPKLFDACATDPTLDKLSDEVSGAFDSDGTLSDRASPRLRELRSERQAARGRMVSRLEELMRRYAGVVQDEYVTEREGRWVIPVRSDAHERFPGIVHATSGSGATLFVEPRAVVPLGNRLKVLDAEVVREEIAIYTRLSLLLGDSLASIEACADALARADVRAATAKLAHDLRLRFPIVTNDAEVSLISARHPLLMLDGVEVVSSDISVKRGHAMVVSGPNAGGKTVALKTLGLAALMVRAGLPVPADAASTVGIFEIVLTDVGDDQSLSKNLSTFSAHVSNLAHVLDETRPGALVLLDEIATGTDPREGEALAAGVLDSLTARGGAVVVTTHYEGLKVLASVDARFVNASVGFDLATMTPTFRLSTGIPGGSSALAVARRFGIPSTVIERAEKFLTREDKNFDDVVKKLEAERAALELAKDAAKEREASAEVTRVKLEDEIARVRAKTHETATREAEELLHGVRRAREELRNAQAKLRAKKHDAGDLKEIARALDNVSHETALGGQLAPLFSKDETPRAMLAPEKIKRGAQAWVARLGAEVEILEVEGDAVRVRAGALKLTVAASELFEAITKSPEKTAQKRSRGVGEKIVSSETRTQHEVAIQTSDNTVDLRGMRTDDALAMATSFLDRSLNDGRRVAFLIHGHGTGAIRDALRKELAESRYVDQFRPGESGEGGDGVTVVWLA